MTMTMTPARAEEPFAPATPAMETYRLSVPPARKPDLTTRRRMTMTMTKTPTRAESRT